MKNAAFSALLAEMAELHDRKNADYAHDENPYSNFEYAARLAHDFTDPVDRVFATLIGVKLARLIELTRPGAVPRNEPLRDTRRDLAVYAALWASYTDWLGKDRQAWAEALTALQEAGREYRELRTPVAHATTTQHVAI